MMPILYPETEQAFDTNGYGILSDAISATVEQELNGMYELTLKYPISGIHAEYIADRCIILAKPDPVSDPQPFRIYRINPVSRGSITVYARHIAYDTMGIPVSPFSADSAADALNEMKSHAAVDCPFDFSTTKDTSAHISVSAPIAIWSLLGGTQGSMLDTYGGEYEFDRYKIKLLTSRGEDRGVTIRYGKNLTTLEQDRNCATCYTGVYPHWISIDGELVQLPEKIIHADGTYSYTRILTLDLSAEFENPPSEDDLRDRATRYMTDNDIGVPDVSWDVQFAQLEQTDEYRGTALLERVLLGDTVSVVFPKMGVNASARAVKISYDSVLGRYNTVTLGKVKSNLADTIIRQQEEIEKKPSDTVMSQITEKLGHAITTAMGGAVRFLDTDGDGNPDELYIADNADPESAVRVWRYNYQGWAASANGYNGPFVLGATLDDGLLAEFVTAANLVAGTIQSMDGESFFVDLDNSIVKIKALQTIEDGQTELRKQLSEIDIRADGIQSSVSSEIEGVKTELSEVRQDATSWSARVEAIEQDGVDKITTGTGITLDKDGLHVDEDGKPTSTLIDASGMDVTRRADGQKLLEVRDTGVKTENLSVRNYVIFGYTRFEKYSDSNDSTQTAMFFYPEGAE